MPPSEEHEGQGWIDSRSFAAPGEPLAPKEIQAFLNWLFADLATRPEPLRLAETARTVRFVRTLATKGLPKDLVDADQAEIDAYWRELPESQRERRARLNKLGERLWSTLLQSGGIKTGRPGEAKRLLGRMREPYWAEIPEQVDLALELIEELAIPPGAEAFAPPRLRSKTLSFQGPAQGRRQDDLSERVYAAYYALGEAKQPQRAQEVAKALNALRIAPKRRAQAEWIEQNVSELAKSYERSRLRQEGKKGDGARSREALRQQAVDWWKMLFRAEQAHLAEQKRRR